MKQQVALVLLVALALRIAAAFAVDFWLDRAGREFLIPGDADGYWTLAGQLARGEEFSMYEPPRRVMRMPGFPLLLAGSIRVAGEHLLPARLLLAVVATAACGFVYWLGAILADHRTGLLAAAGAAVSPTLLGFSVLILSETSFAACLLLSLILFARLAGRWSPRGNGVPDGGSRCHSRPVKTDEDPSSGNLPGSAGPVTTSVHSETDTIRWKLASLAGLMAGVTCLVRPTWILTVPAFAAVHIAMTWIRQRHSCGGNATQLRATDTQNNNGCQQQTLRDRHDPAPWRAILESLCLFAGLIIALMPWTIRNWSVTGHLVPTTLWVGPSLYDGLHPGATGDSDMTFFDDDLLLRQMSEYRMDREYRRRAMDFVRENPGRTAWLGVIKLGRFWKPWPNAGQFQHWWQRAVVAAFFIPMMLGCFIGLYRRRGDVRCLLLTLGPVIYFSAIHTVFVGSLRYRLPAEYPLLILTAIGVLAIRDRYHPPPVSTNA